jgi:hypothetical protein
MSDIVRTSIDAVFLTGLHVISQTNCSSLESLRKSSSDAQAGLLSELSKCHEDLIRTRREADTLQTSLLASHKARDALDKELKDLKERHADRDSYVDKIKGELEEEKRRNRELSDKCLREEKAGQSMREEIKALEAQACIVILGCVRLHVCSCLFAYG